MDLDQDGRRDVITGCWPGELYFFRGAEGGGASPAAKLKDKDGKELNLGQASVVFANDWDRDGDLDLVVGCIEGHVWFVENESGGTALTFKAGVKLEAGGKPISVPQGDSAPVVADWDGDGTLDLVLGAGDGGVRWYANAVRRGLPELGAARALLDAERKPSVTGKDCGRRTKPHVVDWDGDGRLDLLVGDFGMTKPETTELSEEDELRKIGLEAELTALGRVMRPRSQALMRRVLAALEIELPAEGGFGTVFKDLTDEQRKEYSRRYAKEMREDEKLRVIQERMQKVFEELAPLRGRPQIHGRVWLFRRKPVAAVGNVSGG